jgi:hypothetical protein
MSKEKLTTVHARIYKADREMLNRVALKLSAQFERQINIGEVINGLIQNANGVGEIEAEKIISSIGNHIGGPN